MKKIKRLMSVLLSAALLSAVPSGKCLQVQADVSALASSYNTDVNYIAYASEVEDQSQTNYCWAYMADAVLEAYLMKTGNASALDLSEWDMVTQLSSGAYAFTDIYSGGNYRQALAYWTRGRLYGPRLEQNSALTDYYVSETAELGRYQRDSTLSRQNYIQSIKNLVAKYGAAGVSVYFTAETRALTTRDGAYYYPQESSPGVNHGVTVVGWDDNFAPQWFYNSRTTPQQPQNKGAFLVKNSWGKYDASSIGGNTGYYWISYDNYFQDAFAVTQVVDRSKLYDRMYETDYYGFYDFGNGNSYSQSYDLYGGGQWLTAISTYVREGASYRFYLNGQELTQAGGTMAQSGYHTFQLANPVYVSGTIQLRAEVSGNDEAVPMASSPNSHQPDGSNVCLKAFTRTQPSGTAGGTTWNPGTSGNPGTIWYPDTSWSTGAAATVTGVTLTPQNCTVNRGSSRVFTAAVQGFGQPSQRINWQISGSSSANTRITDQGILYVGADETSSVLYIYANSYADPGHSASARVEVAGTAAAVNPGTGTVINGSGTNSGSTGVTNNPGTGTNINGSQAVPDSTGTNQGSGITDSVNINGGTGEEMDEETGIVRVGEAGKGVYAIWEDGTAQYTKCAASSRISVSIPETVTIGGQVYEVTVLDEGALQNHKKVQTVTVGINVSQIGENAFAGCKKLKKIKIKSEQIEYIGDDAFRGIHPNAVIYVPHSCLTDYRQMVRETGNTKVKVKAYN